MLKINTPAELQTGVFFGAERINAFPTNFRVILSAAKRSRKIYARSGCLQ